MGETRIQRAARRRAELLRRDVGESIRRLREDAGLTRAALATAAGVDPSYVTLIEDGRREPSYEVLAAIGGALGADLSIRLYPTTGPRIHDRTSAAMTEGFLPTIHARWSRATEVPVIKPARGVIDVVLAEPDEPVAVVTEVQSQVPRLEQQVRWHRQKELSLPSSDLWRLLASGGAPATSRLLVLRSTRDTREIAATYEATLRVAYPARCVDVLAALSCADAPWPGAGIVWMHVEGGRAELLLGPPRGVRLGR